MRSPKVIKNIGLIIFFPPFKASPDPIQFPTIPNTAAGKPIAHTILLPNAKVIKAAILEAKFTIFALPEAVTKSNPISPV